MWPRIGSSIVCLLALAACASPPRLSVERLWRDDIFNYRPDRVLESRQELLELDPALAATLAAPALQDAGGDGRLQHLMSLFFPAGRSAFSYSAGRSTGAAETWRSRRGDCLSLTLLTYAAARGLGIPAQMQEVRLPVAIDRRGNIDFLPGHVNVRFPDAPALDVGGTHIPAGGFVVDFDLQAGSRQRGAALGDLQILARFYNNRAAEHLLRQDDDLAYAYFKAAINTDPGFAAGYSNLAQLYQRRGLAAEAERLLHHAIALKGGSDAPMRALHKLLVSQGRQAEAQIYADLLKRHEAEDPYFWLGIGLDHLRHGRHGRAIDALERAQALASGFEEIHRYLAIAYWRSGQQKDATRQLSLLAAISRDDAQVAAMSRKFQLGSPE